jgi:hypothetical protein
MEFPFPTTLFTACSLFLHHAASARGAFTDSLTPEIAASPWFQYKLLVLLVLFWQFLDRAALILCRNFLVISCFNSNTKFILLTSTCCWLVKIQHFVRCVYYYLPRPNLIDLFSSFPGER